MLTFLDTGVLLEAARGNTLASARAVAILADPTREFVGSEFLELELLPKPIYFKRQVERKIYEDFFDNVSVWVATDPDITARALAEAGRYGLAAMDALHLAAALIAGAKEFITTEKPSKPIHRARGITITQL